MTQQPVTFQQVTVSEAADILGVSTQTVRRMIRRGQLEGERVHRAQGSAYVVSIPAPNTAGDMDATATQQPAPNVSRSNATDQPPAAEAMVSLIQTTIATVLGPLVAELTASRQTNERQAEQLRTLERENGRQAAELDAARATIAGLTERLERPTAPESSLEASGGPESAGTTQEPPLVRLRPLLPWVLAALAIVVAVGLLVR